MASPRGLAVDERRPERPPASGRSGPLVVLVHGSLDRGSSFARVRRRLADHPTLAYDRRGYSRSRRAGPPGRGLEEHVDDLLEVVDGRDVVLVGHSYGGNVALGAALDTRGAPVLALAAYEPPQPWLRGRASPAAAPPGGVQPVDGDPAQAAERFFRRMVGDAAWDRLSDAERADRRADGPALAAELAAIRVTEPPFDVGALRIPVVYGRGEHSLPHHRHAVAWLVEHTPGAELFEIAGARHGAHLTHPDAFAAMVRRTVDRATGGAGDGVPPGAHGGGAPVGRP